MSYFDDEKKEKYVPYVVEPSLGADRMVLAFCAALMMRRCWMRRRMTCVRFFASIRSGSRKDRCAASVQEAFRGCRKIYQTLSRNITANMMTVETSASATADRMRSAPPFCVTYDFDSETDGCVTVRDRDSMEQVRVKIDELEAYFADKFTF